LNLPANKQIKLKKSPNIIMVIDMGTVWAQRQNQVFWINYWIEKSIENEIN